MKKPILNLTKVLFILLATTFFASCGDDEDEEEPQNWVASYSSITLGAQNNYTYGHFFKPQTGEVVAVESTIEQEKYLALMFFTESGGANIFFTFPADGTEASTFGTSGIRLFTQDPGGIDTWPAASLVSGMIHSTDLTSIQYDNLVSSASWDEFDRVFRLENSDDADLDYDLHYELGVNAGEVYLLQFNGLVRAIICFRTVVPAGVNGASVTFDIIVEGRDIYSNSTSAKYLQPLG